MAEYVKKEDVLALAEWVAFYTSEEDDYEEFECIYPVAVRLMPAADVVEVRHGRWIVDKSFLPFVCTCSVCGWSTDTDGAFAWKGCPECLAKMDLKGEQQ